MSQMSLQERVRGGGEMVMGDQVSPDTRVGVFVSSTGKVHLSETYSWGIGAGCTNRFMQGMATEALVSDVDCGRCASS